MCQNQSYENNNLYFLLLIRTKQMKRNFLITAVLFIFSVHHLLAHALWIETFGPARKGEKQVVKVFWGEFDENQRDPVDKWFSDMADFKLFVVSPGGKKTPLTATAQADHYLAGFTPDEEGIYLLTISHDAKDLGGTTKLQYNSVATVKIGKSVKGNQAGFNEGQLKIWADASKPGKVNRPLSLEVLLKGTPAENVHVEVFSPSGWKKSFQSDSKGNVTFSPIWAGRYQAEASLYSGEEAGEHHGKPHKAVRRVVTYTFDVAR